MFCYSVTSEIIYIENGMNNWMRIINNNETNTGSLFMKIAIECYSRFILYIFKDL